MRLRSLVAAAVIGTMAASASAALKDGAYEAKVIGHNAPMTVKVTIKQGKIESISTKDLESFGVGKVALKEKSAEIIKNQSIGVDAMSGATLSSFALVQGVEECLKAAGATEADLDQWTKQIAKHSTKPLTVTGDVAIIGGGGTGLAAAVSALENGAGKVVIIEKLGYLGGSTNVSGGALNAVDDKRQKAQGIKDSVETFYNSTMKGGHNVGTPELVRYLTENAYPTVEWMEKQGVVFRDRIGAATGSLGQRSHYGVKPAGYAYTSVFENVLKTKYKDRVEFLMECPAEAILTDKNGKVAHKICVVVVGDKKSYTDAAVEAVKEKLGKDDYKLKNRTVKTVTDKATKEYDTAVKEVQAAEEAARQAALAAQRARAIRFSSGVAARSAAAASGGQAYQGGDGAWYVTYRGTDDMTTANADGSVSLWMDGYYIAHRYTQNGSMIASHPQYVVVDGKRYQYAGTVNDLKGSYATPHLDWIDQTGGIVFQTCNTDGATSQINRYLPVG